jgi:two-component system sensor histidine kinase ChiS
MRRRRFRQVGTARRRPRRSSAVSRVLIAEDSDDYREVLQRLFELEGYEVIAAEDGAAALKHLRAGAAPALVITDLMMPNVNGAELVSIMRVEFPRIPFLMLTGDAARAPAGVPVLPKPIDIGALLATVRQFVAAQR